MAEKKIGRTAPTAIIPLEAPTGPTFNLAMALPGRASSRHTARAYFRWIDTYLVDNAGLAPTAGKKRGERMSALPLDVLLPIMNAPQLRAWLGVLNRTEHGKQGINQARAAIVTLASLLAESGLLRDEVAAGMANVRSPNAADGQRPGRWLSLDEVKLLMLAAKQIAQTENQAARNHLVMTMLCTMALRRDELASARWGDLSVQNNRPILQVQGKGKKTAIIDVPKPVIGALAAWRACVAPTGEAPLPESPLVRRLYRGGGVSRYGLNADGVWLIVTRSARGAGLGRVAPHDLRRSVAGALQESGVPIDTISRLLRHSNVAVTERYLSKLPQRNEGAVLMSDMLGLEEDDDPFGWR